MAFSPRGPPGAEVPVGSMRSAEPAFPDFAFRKTNQVAKDRAIPMKMCCARIPQVKGISSPANSSMVQKPMSSGSSSRWGTRYLSAILAALPVRDRVCCSDDPVTTG